MKKSFRDYVFEASADIPSPSGQTIGPTASAQPSTSQSSAVQSSKQAWMPGQPVIPGITVGVNSPNNPNGQKLPGTVSNVNKANNTVDVLDPTTGQTTTHSINDLGAVIGGGNSTTSATNPVPQVGQQMSEQLLRLRQLAGITEDASCGATGAGSIAIAPANMGNTKRRIPVEEGPSLEHPEVSNKTVVGDTKPNQATGRLSANLAARNKKTASRTNNGFKK